MGRVGSVLWIQPAMCFLFVFEEYRIGGAHVILCYGFLTKAGTIYYFVMKSVCVYFTHDLNHHACTNLALQIYTCIYKYTCSKGLPLVFKLFWCYMETCIYQRFVIQHRWLVLSLVVVWIYFTCSSFACCSMVMCCIICARIVRLY